MPANLGRDHGVQDDEAGDGRRPGGVRVRTEHAVAGDTLHLRRAISKPPGGPRQPAPSARACLLRSSTRRRRPRRVPRPPSTDDEADLVRASTADPSTRATTTSSRPSPTQLDAFDHESEVVKHRRNSSVRFGEVDEVAQPASEIFTRPASRIGCRSRSGTACRQCGGASGRTDQCRNRRRIRSTLGVDSDGLEDGGVHHPAAPELDPPRVRAGAHPPRQIVQVTSNSADGSVKGKNPGRQPRRDVGTEERASEGLDDAVRSAT